MARLSLAAVSLVVCAWFATGVRATHDRSEVTALVGAHSSLSAAQARTAKAKLADAAFLNPDQSIDLLRAQIEVRTGDAAGGLRIGEAIVRREPANYQAWFFDEEVGMHIAPPIGRLARAHLRVLAPPVPAAP